MSHFRIARNVRNEMHKSISKITKLLNTNAQGVQNKKTQNFVNDFLSKRKTNLSEWDFRLILNWSPR